MDALLVAFQDGGGLGSSPDWSCPPQGKDNLLFLLRQRGEKCFSSCVFLKGFAYTLRLEPTPVLSLTRRYSSFVMLLTTSRGAMSVSWDVSGGELYCLGDLHCLSRLLSDRDVALFPALAQGVPAGYDGDIPAFHVFSPRSTDVQPAVVLQICEGIGLVRRPTRSYSCSSSGWSLTRVICLKYFWTRLYKPAATRLL